MREAQRLKGLGIPGQTGGLVDLYDVSDDWIPIYDKSDLPGFYMPWGLPATSSRTRRWRASSWPS